MHREDFPLLNEDIIYFDNGATTLKPKCVIAKTVEYYEKYGANAHRGDYDISYKASEEYENTRELVKKFINARHLEEIIFTAGATESLNLVVLGFFKKFLEADAEHASNVLPWFNLVKTNGIKVNYIPLDDNHYVTLDNLKKVITPHTKVISLAYITNVLGDMRPIKEIVEFAKYL